MPKTRVELIPSSYRHLFYYGRPIDQYTDMRALLWWQGIVPPIFDILEILVTLLVHKPSISGPWARNFKCLIHGPVLSCVQEKNGLRFAVYKPWAHRMEPMVTNKVYTRKNIVYTRTNIVYTRTNIVYTRTNKV